MALRIPNLRRARRAECLVALGALSHFKPCFAQEASPRASLVVTRGDGAQGCPDAEALAEQVRTVAGANVVGVGLGPPAHAETWIQVSITRNFGGYGAQINSLGAHHGSRSLEDLGPNCASLADAVAVTIAIFLDPYANAPQPEPAPQVAPAPVVVPPRNREPTAVERPTHWPRLTLGASAGVALNLLEHSEPLLDGEVGVELSPRWSFALGGAFVFPDTKPVGEGEIDLNLSYGYLEACARAWGAPEGLRVDWCTEPLIGRFSASGKGYVKNYAYQGAWFALAVGPRVTFPISGSWGWELSGQGVAPLVRQGFDVQSAGVHGNAFRSASVGGLISVGVRGAL